jgi:hypothetical protein
MGQKRNAYGKAGRKETTGKRRSRWVGNIKMHLIEIGWDGVDWIDMAHSGGLL